MDLIPALNAHMEFDDFTIVLDQIMDCLRFNLELPPSVNTSSVETAIKAAVFIDESAKYFGQNLIDLISNTDINPCLNVQNQQAIAGAAIRIMRTTDGQASAMVHTFEMMLKMIYSTVEVEKILNTVFLNVQNSTVASKQRIRFIHVLQLAFCVPQHHIEKALARVLTEFKIIDIGFVFLEPRNSPYFKKFAIFSDFVCQRLRQFKSNTDILNNFITSIYDLIAVETIGVKFLWDCLKNRKFANSLCMYFALYLKATEKPVNNCIMHTLAILSSVKSPCRTAFFAIFLNENVPQEHFERLQEFVFILD